MSIEEEDVRCLSEIFDHEFQLTVLAHMARDKKFMKRVGALLHADQFELQPVKTIAKIVKRHYEIYDEVPDPKVLVRQFKMECERGIIRDDLVDECKEVIRGVYGAELTAHEYLVSEVSTFAQHIAFDTAIEKALNFKEKGDFEKAKSVMAEALRVGSNDQGDCYDFFENAEERRLQREAYALGTIERNGVPTGFEALDEILFHKGWGRREMTLLMGGLKSGKSIGLGFFACNAALAGKNALLVTLEVHKDIIASRSDAKFTSISMDDLEKQRDEVFNAVTALSDSVKLGKYIIAERMGAPFTPQGLRQIIEDYRAKGIYFDLVALDYLDLARPSSSTNEPRHDEKLMYTDFRSLADEYDFALLSATQTNRTGMGNETATAVDVADNIEKLRIADLTISINATEEEKAKEECRLYMAASRNQAGSRTILVKQNLDQMKFINNIISHS